jgi:hypothetical protein
LWTEQLNLLSQQLIVDTVEDSVLRTEMTGLESQKEDAPKCILHIKRQTFFVKTMGTQIPVIVEKPLAACGCRKFQLDAMGDHLCTCTSHFGYQKGS